MKSFRKERVLICLQNIRESFKLFLFYFQISVHKYCDHFQIESALPSVHLPKMSNVSPSELNMSIHTGELTNQLVSLNSN